MKFIVPGCSILSYLLLIFGIFTTSELFSKNYLRPGFESIHADFSAHLSLISMDKLLLLYTNSSTITNVWLLIIMFRYQQISLKRRVDNGPPPRFNSFNIYNIYICALKRIPFCTTTIIDKFFWQPHCKQFRFVRSWNKTLFL